jgi:hypothetical protein
MVSTDRLEVKMQNEPKQIIQIIPAQDWRWTDEDGGDYPLAAWGLANTGEIVGIMATEQGIVMPVTESARFQGYRYAG